MIFNNQYIDTLTKLYDGMSTDKLKKVIQQYEDEIENAQAKIDVANQVLYSRERNINKTK